MTAKQIKNVRVRFIPETSRTQSNKVATRSLVSDNIYWEEWKEGKGLTPAHEPKGEGSEENPGPQVG